jgi:NDP-sugar pyrophosphorylase family protein
VWFNGGAYVLEHDIFEYVAGGRPCSLEREVFPRVLATGKHIAALASRKPFFDIGTPDGLERFRAFYPGLRTMEEPPRSQSPQRMGLLANFQ